LLAPALERAPPRPALARPAQAGVCCGPLLRAPGVRAGPSPAPPWLQEELEAEAAAAELVEGELAEDWDRRWEVQLQQGARAGGDGS
jgi:hypothetical protein